MVHVLSAVLRCSGQFSYAKGGKIARQVLGLRAVLPSPHNVLK